MAKHNDVEIAAMATIAKHLDKIAATIEGVADESGRARVKSWTLDKAQATLDPAEPPVLEFPQPGVAS